MDLQKWAVSEFLSDAPFFLTLSLVGVEGGKLCMREWVELFDEPRPYSLFIDLLTVHRELEVHTMYIPEVFNTLTETYTQGHFWLFCMLIPCVYIAKDYKLKLEFLNKSLVHTKVQFSL